MGMDVLDSSPKIKRVNIFATAYGIGVRCGSFATKSRHKS